MNLRWSDVDVAPLLTRLDGIEAALKELREGDVALRELGGRIEAKGRQVDRAQHDRIDARARRAGNRAERARRRDERDRCADAISTITVQATRDYRPGEMLRTQSGQTLVALQTHVAQAHKAIRARMEDVNAGLENVPFNRGSILQIKPEDRRLPEVTEFRQQLATGVGNQ